MSVGPAVRRASREARMARSSDTVRRSLVMAAVLALATLAPSQDWPQWRGLIYRGRMDATPDVVRFAETLEKVCVDLVEAGKMTKDLALLISDTAPHLTTDEYLDAVDAELKKRMG